MNNKNKIVFSTRLAYIFFIGTSIIAAASASDLPEKETKKASSLAYQRIRDEIIDKYKDRNPNLLKYKSPPKPIESSARLGENSAKFVASATLWREKQEKENKQLNQLGQAAADVGVVGAQRIENPALKNKVISLIESLRNLIH